jgi:hypothetical protein
MPGWNKSSWWPRNLPKYVANFLDSSWFIYKYAIPAIPNPSQFRNSCFSWTLPVQVNYQKFLIHSSKDLRPLRANSRKFLRQDGPQVLKCTVATRNILAWAINSCIIIYCSHSSKKKTVKTHWTEPKITRNRMNRNRPWTEPPRGPIAACSNDGKWGIPKFPKLQWLFQY